MNRPVYMLKVVMGNVFFRIKHVKQFLVVIYLMVTLMRLV